MNAVLSCNPDGTVECLWTEALPLAEIGTLTVRRASTVEFNAQSQEWEVRLAGNGGVDFSNPSRARCIEWEVAILNRKLAQ